MKRLLPLSLAVIMAAPCHALEKTDSINVPVATVAAGAFLSATGAIGRGTYAEPSRISSATAGSRSTVASDILQFAPFAAPFALKAAGIRTRSGWGHMTVSGIFGMAISTGATEILKRSINTRRPDGDGWHSFPSGHAARAFMGATAMAIELGDTSPWYAAGGYLVAVGIAAERVIDNRHYPADVITGAGIGIISAQLGYWLGDIIFGRPAARDIHDSAGTWRVGLSTGMHFPLHRVRTSGYRLIMMPGLMSGLSGRWRHNKGFTLGLSAGILSSPIALDAPGMTGSTLVAPLNSASVTVSPGWEWTIDRNWAIDTSLGAGVRYHLNLRSAGRAISVRHWSPTGQIETGVSLKLHKAFVCRGSIGYELSELEANMRPSLEYSINKTAACKAAIGAVTASLSAIISF